MVGKEFFGMNKKGSSGWVPIELVLEPDENIFTSLAKLEDSCAFHHIPF